jgi:hypothetical protein
MKFEKLYREYAVDETYMSVSPKTLRPLWGDAAMFGLLRDCTLTGHLTIDGHVDSDFKSSYPSLASMYGSYQEIPIISAWINSKETDNVSNSAGKNRIS